MTLTLHYAARSHVGLVRKGNEDSGYAGPNLLLVADGMGGSAAGEVASAATVDVVQELDRPLHRQGGDDALPDPESALRDAVARAGGALRTLIDGQPALEGMGTTLTALLLAGDRLGIAQVGDSRGYLLRGGELTRLTHDQTFVQSLVDQERITDEQARTHPQRNLLLQALDGRVDVEPVVEVVRPQVGDRLLACSDGLSSYCGEDQIQEALAGGTPAEAADRLVAIALAAGAPDNVTALVADVADGPAEAAGSGELPGVRVGAEAEPATEGATEEAAGDTPPAAERVDDASSEEPRPRRGRAWRRLGVVIVLLAAVAGAAFGAYRWTQAQYSVGTSNGEVVIYQGVARTLAGHHLSHVVETTGIPADGLPSFARDQLASTIPASTRDAARKIVASLDDQLQSCQDEPAPSGCPGALDTPGATPSGSSTTPSPSAS
jgi:protein phosphatase